MRTPFHPVGVLEHKYPQKSNLEKIKKYLTIKIKYSIINITKENKKHFKERGVTYEEHDLRTGN